MPVTLQSCYFCLENLFLNLFCTHNSQISESFVVQFVDSVIYHTIIGLFAFGFFFPSLSNPSCCKPRIWAVIRGVQRVDRSRCPSDSQSPRLFVAFNSFGERQFGANLSKNNTLFSNTLYNLCLNGCANFMSICSLVSIFSCFADLTFVSPIKLRPPLNTRWWFICGVHLKTSCLCVPLYCLSSFRVGTSHINWTMVEMGVLWAHSNPQVMSGYQSLHP